MFDAYIWQLIRLIEDQIQSLIRTNSIVCDFDKYEKGILQRRTICRDKQHEKGLNSMI